MDTEGQPCILKNETDANAPKLKYETNLAWPYDGVSYGVNIENLDYNLFSKLIKRTGQKI